MSQHLRPLRSPCPFRSSLHLDLQQQPPQRRQTPRNMIPIIQIQRLVCSCTTCLCSKMSSPSTALIYKRTTPFCKSSFTIVNITTTTTTKRTNTITGNDGAPSWLQLVHRPISFLSPAKPRTTVNNLHLPLRIPQLGSASASIRIGEEPFTRSQPAVVVATNQINDNSSNSSSSKCRHRHYHSSL